MLACAPYASHERLIGFTRTLPFRRKKSAHEACKIILIYSVRGTMPGEKISQDTRLACRQLRARNMSFSEIGRQLGVSPASAKRHALRTGSTADKPRSGRPKVTTSAQRSNMKKKAFRGRSMQRIKDKHASYHRLKISIGTVYNVLHGGRKHMVYGPVCRGKVLSPKNKKLRLDFCQNHIRDSWAHTVFVDSKYLYVAHDEARGLRYKWHYEGEEVVYKANPNPMVFHFYAAVAKGHKTKLVFVPPTKGECVADEKEHTTFKSEHFISAMQALKDDFGSWFSRAKGYRVVLDHAKQHSSKKSQAALEAMTLPIMHDFPAQSFDINVIELCWGILDHNLQGHNPRTWEGWQKAICKAWDEVEINTINKVVLKAKGQIDKIIEQEGGWVSYKPLVI